MLNFLRGAARGALLAAVLGLGATAQVATAGTIILEGSDAIGFHSNDNTFAAAYRDQVWSAIGGSDPRSIAIVGGFVSAGTIISNTHAISRFSTLTAAGSLSDYAAIYFLAGDGCCEEDDSLPAGHEADILAYLGAGGTIMIENYSGNAAWDFAVQTGGAGSAHVGGIGGTAPGFYPGCDDGETVTAAGIANGFTQPGPLGCWTHQGYDTSFFGPLGFTLSFFDSPPAYSGEGNPPGPWSSLLSSGLTHTGEEGGGGGGTVPEPASILLVGSALALLGFSRRRRLI